MISLQVNRQRKIRKHLQAKLKKQAVHHNKVVAELNAKLQEAEWQLQLLRQW